MRCAQCGAENSSGMNFCGHCGARLAGKTEPLVSLRRSELRKTTAPHPSVFVGRADELRLLRRSLDEAENCHGQAIGIVGEPGIGKSRLLSEFRRQVAGRGASFAEGRCISYGTGIPYSLVLDLLRSDCRIVEADQPDAIIAKVRSRLQEMGMEPDASSPILLHLLGVSDVSYSAMLPNAEAIKAKTFEVFRRLIVKASSQSPLVVMLEDLQWVDKMSEELIGFLVDGLADARILLLATYRPGYQPPWLDRSNTRQIHLLPLSSVDSLDVVGSVLPSEHLVDLVVEEIVAKAGGNSFFLEQLALHAGEGRGLQSALTVPNTIHDVVMARIDRLPDDTKRLLQTAAVIGREFPLRLLNAVWQGSGSAEDHLRELSRLEFVYERVETEGSVYGFRHALTQETAYGSLPRRQRHSHHGAVGEALEKLHRDRAGEIAELLAWHFGRSDEADKSVDYAILAGEKAQLRWANREALSYFDDALQRLDLLSDTPANRLRRIDAVIKQAEVKFALGQHADHVQALDRIRGLVGQSGDPRRRAIWHYWRGFLHSLTGGRADAAIDDCNEAIRVAAGAGLEEVRARAESCLAQIHLFTGKLRAAIATGERALACFEALGDRWWACRTLAHLSPAAIALGEWSVSLRYCRRIVEHGAVLDDLRPKVTGLWRMGATYIYQGDTLRGRQCCDQALALGALPYDAAMAKTARGYGKIKSGEIDSGIADLSEAVGWFETSRLRYTHARFALLLAEGHLRRSDDTSARPLIENALETSRAMGYLHLEGLVCWLMAEYFAPDDPASAEPHAERAIEILARIGARNDLARAMLTRAALRQADGDVTAARGLLDRADLIFRELGTLDEPARVRAAFAALDRGSALPLLASRS